MKKTIIVLYSSMILLISIACTNVNADGAYIHIPFCRRRCYYCDFSIKVVGDREKTINRETDDYISLLTKGILVIYYYRKIVNLIDTFFQTISIRY